MRNKSSALSEGIDYLSFDMSWYQDIASKLWFNNQTLINFINLSEKSQDSFQLLKSLLLDSSEKNIFFKTILQELWIKSYIIIEDNKKRNIDNLKKEWVSHIWRMNNFWDFDIESIDWNFNNFDYGSLSKNSLCTKHNKPYVLFYNKENPTKILDKLRKLFSEKYHCYLPHFNI